MWEITFLTPICHVDGFHVPYGNMELRHNAQLKHVMTVPYVTTYPILSHLNDDVLTNQLENETIINFQSRLVNTESFKCGGVA